MCRSIKVLRRTPPPATAEEIHAAALQFIRKVSGTRNPPSAFLQAYNGAVGDVAAATERLLAVMGAPRHGRYLERPSGARATGKLSDAHQQP